LRPAALAVPILATAVSSFLVWLVWPLDGEMFLNLRVPDWPTALFALFDGAIAVGVTLWLVALIRRRWPAQGPLVGKAGRASYATYFLHPRPTRPLHRPKLRYAFGATGDTKRVSNLLVSPLSQLQGSVDPVGANRSY
jgi:hypothetical protein